MFTTPIKNNTWHFFLRIMVPALSIIHFLSFYADYRLFFSEEAYIKPDIMDAALDRNGVSAYTVFNYLGEHGYQVEYFLLVKSIIFIYILFLLFLMLGFMTRISAIISICLHYLILQSMHHYVYGADYFFTILLFYCALLPLNRYYSLDNLISRRRTERVNAFVEQFISAKVVLRLMQAHICIAYFFSGFDKVLGPTWRDGEAVWKAMHNFNGVVNYEFFDTLASTPVFLIAGWATVLLEMLYPIMANLKYTRVFWLVGIIGMHISIVLLFGLFHFSAIMIVFNLATYIVPFSPSFSVLPEKSKKSGPVPALQESV
jgi:Vitamin K-dependent gamma-carboxylase